MSDHNDRVDGFLAAWADSGAMALTGRADGPPLGPPRPLVPHLGSVAGRIADVSRALGRAVALDPLALLGERAALRGLRRRGRESCGGSTRLLGAADGFFAVSLGRGDDMALVPAWLELGPAGAADAWAAIHAAAGRRTVAALVARGRLLGLPVAALAETAAPAPWSGLPVTARSHGPAAATDLAGLTVVDLSALWAGPLAGSVLALAGARVVRVEATGRPDGLRAGDPALFDLLNGGKRSVALDLRTPAGVAGLRRLVSRADVVIEASRPRALAQLGLPADDLMSTMDGPRVWLSITGHGRHRDWVAFGDDAAVAGGLVATDGTGPCFCADAVADPATGLVAAAAALTALSEGGRWLLDVSLSGVAAWLAGPTLPVPPGLVAAPPRARTAPAPAPPLGADTDRVLSTLD